MTIEPDLLHADGILSALPVEVRDDIVSLQVVDETGSTQADALAAPIPPQGCSVLLAERQTAGEGRLGRRWLSPRGSGIALSLSRRFDRGAAQMAGLSLAVGVAVAEALQGLGLSQLRLKWPNDLQVEGRKLGGILINLRAERTACAAVIGIGLNVRMPADLSAVIGQPVCDLASLLAPTPSRNEVAAAVLARLLPVLQEFELGGFAPLRARWQPLDALVGQPVHLVEGDVRHAGLCLGVSPDGALRVREDGGSVRDFHGGEASVRAA